jgi:hypothetical protein
MNKNLTMKVYFNTAFYPTQEESEPEEPESEKATESD